MSLNKSWLTQFQIIKRVMESDFSFGFNDAKFSDRLLRIEITGGGEVSCSSIADRVRDRKRKRLDCNNNVLDLAVESDLNKNQEEASKSGYKDENLTTSPSLVRVKELHISSLILAAKSPFFFKLFSNGMLESEQRDVTLTIDATEEAAVMELLEFMYTNSLSVTTASALLDVLMAADKYEVASCIKYCSRALLDMPMTVDSALLLLDLPSSVVATDSANPLTIAARQFLASYYKDIFKCPAEEVVALPLVGIEAILASDDLEIRCEDILYDIVLKWAKIHYPDLEERQEIFGSHLAPYIRFPHMTCRKLAEIMTSNDFKPSVASNIVLEALLFKAESKHGRRTLAAQQPVSNHLRFVERAYKYRPIQFMEFEIPRHQCIVYLDLTRKECAGLYPIAQLSSQVFPLGGLGFVLYAQCNMDQSSSFHCFGLFLGLGERQPVNPTVDYKFSARSKPTEEFVGKFKTHRQFAAGMLAGKRNLFGIPWESFMSKDCPYFINDVLHLRARLSIRH